MKWLETLDYWVTFSNGEKLHMTLNEANQYAAANNTEIVAFRTKLHSSSTESRYSDAWRPGYQIGLGKVIESRREYKEELKRRGLIEAGDAPFKPETVVKKKKYLDEGAINFIRDHDVSLDEGTVKEINDQ